MASKYRPPRQRLSRDQVSAEALRNALAERSTMNYEAILSGFAEKGIALDKVVPRVNVFTYNAWRALGRQVRKGETGVQVVTWIQGKTPVQAPPAEGAQVRRFPRTTTVFHVSQTDEISQDGQMQSSSVAQASPPSVRA
jgi:hypothetical protein